MNPTEIFDALDKIASAPFDPVEFPFAFAEATDNARATISKLRNGSTNKSDVVGGVLLNRKFHYAPAPHGEVEAILNRLRASKRTAAAKPALLLVTDGEEVGAQHLGSGDLLHCRFDEIGDKFGFFLPAAGKERYQAVEENPIDVKATGRLAKLYDALIRANPEWGDDTHRHAMNQLMMRLIFCLFAEDVGIFPDGQFSRLIFTHAGDRGEEAREVIVAAFTAMNQPKDARSSLPAWTVEIEYVNGGLFAGEIDAPKFDWVAFRYLRDAARLKWREINPDIFGSMIQSVADPVARSELGMHYTSAPNILSALRPLFLDELDAEIEGAWERPRMLEKVLGRLGRIRVFDPACGSGNFLVIAYRELRAREIRIVTRLQDLKDGSQGRIWSDAELSAGLGIGKIIALSSFYGIEIADFAVETAKLALFIAEQQANRRFGEATGRMPKSLPLAVGGTIFRDNALRVDWEVVCPPLAGDADEVYIVANPPYYGAKKRNLEQNADMEVCGLGDAQILDYVSAWIEKASRLARRQVDAAFVATSSICQGEQVSRLWPRILARNIAVKFAYRPFHWRNSAADVAGVTVTILGLSRTPPALRRLFDSEVVTITNSISPYLVPGPFIPVSGRQTQIGGLPDMTMGSNAVDGKWLILTQEEADVIIASNPEASRFLKRYLGGNDLIYDTPRSCIWIADDEVGAALAIPAIAWRIEACRVYRMDAGRDARRAAKRPYAFCYSTWKDRPALMVPGTQSENRIFIPAAPIPAGPVVSHAGFAIYDAPSHILAIIGSTLHRIWLGTVGGRLRNDFRYAVSLVYNTFPVPNFTAAQKEQLSTSARHILKTRYRHYPKTLAELYDPEIMPDDLRAVHKENDDFLETMYIGRPFRNDTERLEKLFKLYAARATQDG